MKPMTSLNHCCPKKPKSILITRRITLKARARKTFLTSLWIMNMTSIQSSRILSFIPCHFVSIDTRFISSSSSTRTPDLVGFMTPLGHRHNGRAETYCPPYQDKTMAFLPLPPLSSINFLYHLMLHLSIDTWPLTNTFVISF